MAERLFQVGIKGLITNAEGRILLLQSVGRAGEERWDLPGGRMDDDETFEQTLQRELIEEIGISYIGEPVFVKSVLSNVTIKAGEMHVGLILNVYRVTIPPDVEIQLNDYETAYEWVDTKDAALRMSNKYPPEFTELIAAL